MSGKVKRDKRLNLKPIKFTYREIQALATIIVYMQKNMGYLGNHIVEGEELETAYEKIRKVKNN